jgi:hypothetical protein
MVERIDPKPGEILLDPACGTGGFLTSAIRHMRSRYVKRVGDYLLRTLKAMKPEMLSRVTRSSHGTGRIEGVDYRDFLLPIPPAKVHDQIVAKVDELMSLCDKLEASLHERDDARNRLLDSLIAEALAPAAAVHV